ENGALFIASRDIPDLQSRFGNRARRAFADRAAGDFAREGLVRFEPEVLPDHVESEAGLRAWPAFVDRGDHVDLAVFETAAEAGRAHRQGIARLLRLRLADQRRRAARQLPIDARAQFGWASIGSLDTLRTDIVDHALAGLFDAAGNAPRNRADFDTLAADVGDRLIRAANQRALLVSAALAALAQTSPVLSPPLLGFAVANFDDLRAQLKRLFPDDLGRSVPDARLADYPRYLKAMVLRAERLQHDPRK